MLDTQIKQLVKETDTPLLTISSMSYSSAGMILAEIGNIELFDSPAKLLAFAGLEPSNYQSGNSLQLMQSWLNVDPTIFAGLF